MPIVILLPGPPVPKGRHRSYYDDKVKFVRNYTPEKTVKYENRVKAKARRVMRGLPIMTGPVTCRLKFSMPIPKSWARRKRSDAALGLIRPASRPDLDNLLKAILDALNLIVFVDDSQITDLIVTKRYAEEPGVEVTVAEIADIGLEQQRCAA